MNSFETEQPCLYLLYYTATENTFDESFVFQYLEKKEGIPIGKLFFWIKGVWGKEEGLVSSEVESLYQEITGVSSLNSNDGQTVGPFQNIEEVRRFSYLLCQRLNSSKIRLLSVDDFNNAIRNSSSKEELMSSLISVADHLENQDQGRSQSFFTKVISRNK